MKPETEIAIRSIAEVDAEITTEMLERAVRALRGKTDEDVAPPSVVSIKETADILGVSERTAFQYLSNGLLDRVYRFRRRGIGVSRESLDNFLSHLMVVNRGFLCEENRYGRGTARKGGRRHRR